MGSGALSANNETIGLSGTGTFTQTGGTNTVTNDLTLGGGTTGSGTYDLSSGNLSADNESIGLSGTGTFTQTGGTNTLTGNLSLGGGTTDSGTYDLSSGDLLANSEDIGESGTGAFTQTGGTNTVTGNLRLGVASGSSGTYDLSSGTLSVNNQETIGYAGTGAFTQTGGTHSVAGGLILGGGASGSSGTYDLSFGNLLANGEAIGFGGTGTFTQTGGTHSVTGNLLLGSTSDSSGTYDLSGGALNVDGNIINSSGTGNINIDGGTLTAFGGLIDVDNFSVGNAGGSSGSHTLAGGESLSASYEYIGLDGTGAFTQTGGTNTVTYNLTLGRNSGSNGTYDLNGGALNVGGNIADGAGTGTLNINGGTLTVTGGDIGVDSLSIGAAGSRSMGAGETITTNTSLINNNSFTIGLGAVVTANGSGLTNNGTLSLSGTLGGSGGVTNDFGAQLNGRGTIATTLQNNGTLETTGFLTVTGTTTNLGQINVQTAENFRAMDDMSNFGLMNLAGGAVSGTGGIDNFGIINLDGGAVSVTGVVANQAGGIIRGGSTVSASLTNDGGLIHANNSSTFLISNFSGGNINGGELRVEDGSTLNILNNFSSSGTTVLKGTNATLAGGTITNTGTMSGIGRVTNTVANNGIIRAEGGQLTLSGTSNTNTTSGQIQVSTGNTVLLSQGLSTNAGTIALAGGTFDNNNNVINNTGDILGSGTFRSSDLINDNVVSFADVDTVIYGNVTNNANLDITNNTTTFFDLVNNSATGTIKNTAGTARFLGGLVNSGAYISDPAENNFTNLTVTDPGYMVGGIGDHFHVSGDFSSNSTQNLLWNTDFADLFFEGGTSHMFDLTGADVGASILGLDDNFAWGSMTLGIGESLILQDGNLIAGGALYLDTFLFGNELSQVSSYITGNGLDIYYNPLASGNAYLGGQTFALGGSGILAPMAVPEPSIMVLLGIVFAVLAGVEVRRRQEKKYHRIEAMKYLPI